jgi:hypothetical protein
MLRRRFLACLLGVALTGPLTTVAHAGDIPWSSLSPEEQRILGKARDRWDQMPTERQQRLLRGAHRWQDMSPEQRDAARERWKQRREQRGDYHRQRHDYQREPRSERRYHY